MPRHGCVQKCTDMPTAPNRERRAQAALLWRRSPVDLALCRKVAILQPAATRLVPVSAALRGREKARPARLVRAGPPLTEHAGFTLGMHRRHFTQCPQSGFFLPRLAIFGQFPVSFGLTPSRDVPVNARSAKTLAGSVKTTPTGQGLVRK